MFITSVSVIVPVVDGHAVRAYTRNGSNIPRCMNLCSKSTWIKVVVKYIKRLLRINSSFFTRHLYCILISSNKMQQYAGFIY